MDSLSQTDEFFDDWGSPGFRDQLFRNVALAEKQAEETHAAKSNDNSFPNKLLHADTHGRPNTTFQIFRDPLQHGNRVSASPQQQKQTLTPLREIDSNQFEISTIYDDNQKKKGKGPALNFKQGADMETVNHTITTTATTAAPVWSPKLDIQTTHPSNANQNQPPLSPLQISSDVDTKKTEFDEDEDMWGIEFDVDFPSLINDLENSGSGNQLDQAPDVPNDRQRRLQQEDVNETNDMFFMEPQMESTLDKFGGFMTAGSKKQMTIDSTARQKAVAFFNNDTTTKISKSSQTNLPSSAQENRAPKQTVDSRPLPPPSSSSSSTSPNPQTTTANSGKYSDFEEPNSLKLQKQKEPIPPKLGGFTTGTGRPVAASSKEALRKAENLLLSNQPSSERSIKSKQEEEQQQLQVPVPVGEESSICGQKRPAEDKVEHDNEELQFKYEDVLSHYGGFMMGNSKTTISVSTDAKQRAVALFNSSETTRELTQASQSTSSQRPLPPSSPSSSANSQQASPLHRIISHEDKPHVQISTQKPNETVGSRSQQREPTPSPPPPPALPAQKQLPARTLAHKPVEQLPPPPPPPQKRLKRRHVGANLKMKPFKSPVIQANYELTKAAASGKLPSGSIRCKGPTVFSMHATGTRYPLSQLGKPLQYNLNDLKSMNISDEILHLTAANASKVRFSGWGPKEAREAIRKAGALERFISDAWVENHYRWIVWKIACMIRSYPLKFKDWWCTRKVVEQLLYRYEREINMGHRSVLKRIHEQDDNPAKHMVLAVVDIKPFAATEDIGQAAAAAARNYQLVLTDGWYQINAVTDPRLERAIAKGKVAIGSKLSICGAQLNGDAQPRSPLSASANDSVLSITTNGSRLAAWDTKLGYQRNRLVLRSLSNVYDDGGIITALDVIVCRKYPMMYTEVLSDGTRVKRTAREEEEERRRVGAELHHNCDDGGGGGGGWAPRFQEHSGMRMVQQRGKPPEESSPTKPEERIVSAHFKVQLCDYRSSSSSGSSEQRMGTLLLLDANELKHLDICEGSRYKIYFTMPYTLTDKSNHKNPRTIHLKTTRKTQWESVSNIDEAMLASTLYIPRHITTTASLATLEKGSEIDIAVLVLHSTCSDEESRTTEGRALWYQTLLVTDASGGLCQVKLKLPCRPLKGVDGQVVGFTNVTHEVHDTKYSITHLRAGDNSEIFNKQKAAPYMQQAIHSVRQWAQANPEELQAMKQRVNQFLL